MKLSKPNWGLLPDEVSQIIVAREWTKTASIKARLTGDKPFPITLALKPPKGSMAVNDLTHFQDFIKSWQAHPLQHAITWEERQYRSLLKQDIPCKFTLSSFDELVQFIGIQATQRSDHWRAVMTPFVSIDKALFKVLANHLSTLDSLSVWEASALSDAVLQLKEGLGQDLFLRSLPLTGIHTKLIENYIPLLTGILDCLHDQAISNAGGLMAWLGCIDIPNGWLHVRPLCEQAKAKMGGFSYLGLPTEELRRNPLPADNILIVENDKHGFSVPDLPNTIMVFGGGKNTAWTNAAWLRDKNVGYWGDIDSWGLSILSDVRSNIPNVTSLMMDESTLATLEQFSTIEPKPVEQLPKSLTREEQALFATLTQDPTGAIRLEQEYCPQEYAITILREWIKH